MHQIGTVPFSFYQRYFHCISYWWAQCCIWIWPLKLMGWDRKQVTEEMNAQMNGYVHLIDQTTSGRHGAGGDWSNTTHWQGSRASPKPIPSAINTIISHKPHKLSTSKSVSGNELHIIRCFVKWIYYAEDKVFKKRGLLAYPNFLCINGFSQNVC